MSLLSEYLILGLAHTQVIENWWAIAIATAFLFGIVNEEIGKQ